MIFVPVSEPSGNAGQAQPLNTQRMLAPEIPNPHSLIPNPSLSHDGRSQRLVVGFDASLDGFLQLVDGGQCLFKGSWYAPDSVVHGCATPIEAGTDGARFQRLELCDAIRRNQRTIGKDDELHATFS